MPIVSMGEMERMLTELGNEMCELLLFTTCRRHWPNDATKWCKACRAVELSILEKRSTQNGIN